MLRLGSTLPIFAPNFVDTFLMGKASFGLTTLISFHGQSCNVFRKKDKLDYVNFL